jgi:hypothetical protein
MMYGGVDVYIHVYLTSALDGAEWSDSRPGHFTSDERAPVAHFVRGWVGPRAGVDAFAKRNVYSPAGNRTLVVQPVDQTPTCHMWSLKALARYKVST